MDPEDQIERTNKVRSPLTLRRLLSEESPETLVARFAHRVAEVTGNKEIPPLSQYEMGRIQSAQENSALALSHFGEAVDSHHDYRGYKAAGLSSFFTELNGEPGAIEFLRQALIFGIDDYETNLTLGMAYEQLHRKCPDFEFDIPYWPPPPMHQNIYLLKALRQSKDPSYTRRFLTAFSGLLDGNELSITEM